MQVRFLGWEVLLKKELATHSNILTWRVLRTEEPGGLQSMHGVAKELDTTEQLTLSLLFIRNVGPTKMAYTIRTSF